MITEEFYNKVHKKADGKFANTPGVPHVKNTAAAKAKAVASDKKAGVWGVTSKPKSVIKSEAKKKLADKPADKAPKSATKPEVKSKPAVKKAAPKPEAIAKGTVKVVAKAKVAAKKSGDDELITKITHQMDKNDLAHWATDQKDFKTAKEKLAFLKDNYPDLHDKATSKSSTSKDPVERVAADRFDRSGNSLKQTDPFSGKSAGMNSTPPPKGAQSLKNMTDDHIAAMLDYRGEGFMDINSQLRSGNVKPAVAAAIKVLDSAFDAVPMTTEDFVVYRAIGYLNPKDLGRQFTDQAYVSTSYSRDIAQNFAIEMTDDPKSPVITIKVPKGSKVLKLSDEKGHEAEILLPRYAKFTLQSDGTYTYEAAEMSTN